MPDAVVARAAQGGVGFRQELPGIVEEAGRVIQGKILDVLIGEIDGPGDHHPDLGFRKGQDSAIAQRAQAALQFFPDVQAEFVGAPEGDRSLDADGHGGQILVGQVGAQQSEKGQGREEFVQSAENGQALIRLEAENGPEKMVGRVVGRHIGIQAQLAILGADIGIDQIADFGLDAVIDLIVDQVVEDGRQGGVGVGAIEKSEDMMKGVKLAALEGHYLVDDDGHLLDIAALASDSQAIGRFGHGLDESVYHAWCHTVSLPFDYCFNDISMSSYPHPFSFIWSNQWQSKYAR